jgi:hypothetical protein
MRRWHIEHFSTYAASALDEELRSCISPREAADEGSAGVCELAADTAAPIPIAADATISHVETFFIP